MPDLLQARDLDRDIVSARVSTLLHGADDGELFLEERENETLVFDDNRLRTASFDRSQGFGLRAVAGECTAFAHSSEISVEALERAGSVCRSVLSGPASPHIDLSPARTNHRLYGLDNPAQSPNFSEKLLLLETVNAFARARDPCVRQVTVSLSGDHQAIEILRADGAHYRDVRPLLRFNVSIVCDDGTRQAQGSAGFGGREAPATYLDPARWQAAVEEAVTQALVGLVAEPAPAGEMDVVLGAGWPGILLHEAIGHGLEGDFNRKGESVFAGLMGQRIASPGVTVWDDGTLPGRRGSLTLDDEGTPSQRTLLIEDGILVGLMQDRMNGRLTGKASTGNGRRQSHAHAPMPRMTNTYMDSGSADPQEIIASVSKGLYAKSFGGGQVDITSGKFVFSCTEAYLIENGKITRPVRGATIIGSGADALTRIAMVGNDMALDPGMGMCGKQGQGVPVGVGQPTLRINAMTVGGTGR